MQIRKLKFKPNSAEVKIKNPKSDSKYPIKKSFTDKLTKLIIGLSKRYLNYINIFIRTSIHKNSIYNRSAA